MPVVIREIVTEVALAPGRTTEPAAEPLGRLPEEEVDRVVRRCTERVLEVLRREWEQ